MEHLLLHERLSSFPKQDQSYGERQQAFALVASPRNFGGLQWYGVCPKSRRRVGVLYRPLRATSFASRHAWGRRAAYASQFLDPVGRAWRVKAKVKARLIGDKDPDEWDLPPKPKGMRWATYEKWEVKYDAVGGKLDVHCRLTLTRLRPGIFIGVVLAVSRSSRVLVI